MASKYRIIMAAFMIVFISCLYETASLFAAGSGHLKIYMAKGKGASSVLSDEDYHKVFKTIFAGHDLTIDTSSGAGEFLDHLLSSDLAYISLHSNPQVLVVGNGDRVYPDNVAEKFRALKHSPGLVFIVGCSTLREGENHFPRALQIEPDSSGKAYIGFATPTIGYVSDRYFRVFLAAWFKPKPEDNQYRTLEEARIFAKDFITQRIASGHCTGQGKIGQFGILDPRVADSLKIVGDTSLKVTDLGRATNPRTEPETPASENHQPDSHSEPPQSSGQGWRPAW